MSWSLSANGHAQDKETEARVLDVLRAAMNDEEVGATTARVYTQHHGHVDLLASPGEPSSAVL